MSKERELLERILVSGIFDSNLFEDWEQYIQELLAQPEQEPVAYVYAYDYLDSLYYATDKDVADYPRISRDGKPLYAVLPKREPLSEDEIAELWGESYSGTTQMVRDFARAIEKAHGIGGSDE
jgi:hypothetical protein